MTNAKSTSKSPSYRKPIVKQASAAVGGSCECNCDGVDGGGMGAGHPTKPIVKRASSAGRKK
jgi:hypothetical protein